MTRKWSSNIAVSQTRGSHLIKKTSIPAFLHHHVAVFFLFVFYLSLILTLYTMNYEVFPAVFCFFMQQSVYTSKCMVYWCMRVWWTLEAVLMQHSDYSGILGHRQIRPIGKTTGKKQRKYHSVLLMKQHMEERWLSDLTLRGFKTKPEKVREAKFDSCHIGGRDVYYIYGVVCLCNCMRSACTSLRSHVCCAVVW